MNFSDASVISDQNPVLVKVYEFKTEWSLGAFSGQRQFPSVDHMAASAAHVAQYALAVGDTSEKKWSILVLLLAISSFLEGRPTFLPVLM